jgi:lipoprotein-anchoring transpeptidase ErfK/SrfK
MSVLQRAAFAAGAALMLTACAPPPPEMAVGPAAPPAAALSTSPVAPAPAAAEAVTTELTDELVARYAKLRDRGRTVPAIDPAAFDPGLLRQVVPYATREAPGTLVIDTANRHLYLVQADGTAIRYGVAIGREGFGWTGEGEIGRKAVWPTWTPPPEMIARDPKLARWAAGMPGGPRNPLGARSLYIYFGGVDSQFRIHGTNEPSSIGLAASSGCFRMLNHDVIDLYDRVEPGARVVVI